MYHHCVHFSVVKYSIFHCIYWEPFFLLQREVGLTRIAVYLQMCKTICSFRFVDYLLLLLKCIATDALNLKWRQWMMKRKSLHIYSLWPDFGGPKQLDRTSSISVRLQTEAMSCWERNRGDRRAATALMEHHTWPNPTNNTHLQLLSALLATHFLLTYHLSSTEHLANLYCLTATVLFDGSVSLLT